MFKKTMLIASAAAATLVAVPAAAEAQSYGYQQPYYGQQLWLWLPAALLW